MTWHDVTAFKAPNGGPLKPVRYVTHIPLHTQPTTLTCMHQSYGVCPYYGQSCFLLSPKHSLHNDISTHMCCIQCIPNLLDFSPVQFLTWYSSPHLFYLLPCSTLIRRPLLSSCLKHQQHNNSLSRYVRHAMIWYHWALCVEEKSCAVQLLGPMIASTPTLD